MSRTPILAPTVVLVSDWQSARVARLATVDANGSPHIVPIVFAVVGDMVVTVVDGKPKSSARLRRLANIAANPAVSILVDHYDDDDWSQLWWVRVDGLAEVVSHGIDYDAGLTALWAKYRQYRGEVTTDGPMIIIRNGRISSWASMGRNQVSGRLVDPISSSGCNNPRS